MRNKFKIGLLVFLLLSCNSGNESQEITTTPTSPELNDSINQNASSNKSNFEIQTHLHRLLKADTVNIDSLAILLQLGANLNEELCKDYHYTYDGIFKDIEPLSSDEKGTYCVNAISRILNSEPSNIEDVFTWLLNNGADPNFVSSDGISVIEQCMQRYANRKFIDTLINRGVDVKSINLGRAGISINLIKTLVKKGADPTTINVSPFVQSGSDNWINAYNFCMQYDIEVQHLHPSKVLYHHKLDKVLFAQLKKKGLNVSEPVQGAKGKVTWLEVFIKRGDDDAVITILNEGACECPNKTHPYDLATKWRRSNRVLEEISRHCGKPK